MGTLDPQAKQVLDMMAAAGGPTLDMLPPVKAREAAKQAFGAMQSKKEDVASVKDISCKGPHGDIPLRVYRPKGSQDSAVLPVLVHFHGGGWVICDLDTHDTFCRRISNAAGVAVVAVDYRMGPEHKFPAAVDDCLAATRYVADNAASLKVDASRLAVGGDSAGGNLAASVALAARDAGKPAIKFQVLIYPATDLRGQSASYTENAKDYFLTKNLMLWFREHYLNGPQDEADWRASPLLAKDHGKLPAAYVLTCGFDPLRDEGNDYADKLKKAGVPVQLSKYDGQIHGFLLLDAAIPEANRATAEIASALKKALA